VTVEDAGKSALGTGTGPPGSRWAAFGWTLLGLILIALLVISLTQCWGSGAESQSGGSGTVGWTTRVPWLSPTLVAILVLLLILIAPTLINRVIVNLRPRDSDWSEGIPSTLRSGASRPEQILPELGHLTERLEIWTARASSHQSDYLALGRQLIVLSQLAVLFLTLQLVLQHEVDACGIILIVGELGCLALVLRAVVLTAGPTKEWVRARVRAELLRREQFLAVSGVGPYLTAEDLAERVRLRLHELESDEPMHLIALAADGGAYREQLEDARLDEHQGRRGLARLDRREQAMVAYLVHRLQDQLEYYERRSREHRYLDERFNSGMKYVLILSLAAAAMHLVLVLANVKSPWLPRIVDVLAIALPPLGIALYSLRGLYEWRRLSRAYLDQSRSLQRMRDQLLELHTQLTRAQPPAELVIVTPTVSVDATVLDTRAMTELGELEFKFRRLVLEAEELFAAELRQWYVLIRAEHAPGPV
jgi:hypothetical protein